LEKYLHEHPYIVRDWGLKIIEVICIDDQIDATNEALKTAFILTRKFSDLVLTLPPHTSLEANVEEKLKELAKKINLKIVLLSDDQAPFSLDFAENFNSTEDAVLRLKIAKISKKISREFAEITPFKSSALDLLQMTSNPAVSFSELEEKIAHEPLLIARIMQIANSAYFIRRSKAQDLDQALAYIGIDGFRQVLVQLIFHNLATRYFSKQKNLLNHAEAVSYLAVKLAGRISEDTKLLAKIRVAGLLHDIGALALQYCFAEEFDKVCEIQNQSMITKVMAERKVFGLDHCEIGEKLCFGWGMPAYLLCCIKEHHIQPSGRFAEIIEPVVIANAFLNKEIGHLPDLDYLPLLEKYSLTESNAQTEVKNFLMTKWLEFKEAALDQID
jgi:putative nucleotidyltransferase with HDIG domain